jgi:hypothetical protein
VLEAVFILLELSSPSRRIFIGSHSLPPSLVRRIGPSPMSVVTSIHLPCGYDILKPITRGEMLTDIRVLADYLP